MMPDLPQAHEQTGAYRWWIVAMLWLVCFANYADRQAIFSIFPPLQQEFSLSRLQLGALGSAFMWVYALAGPLAGWLSDRLSRRAILLAALLFWSLCTAATAIAHDYTTLLICRALGGLGEAFYFPAAISLIADYHGRATRSRAMAAHQSAVYAGSIAGGSLTAWLAVRHGWRQPFLLFGAFGLVLAAVLFLALREPPRGAADRAKENPSALRTPHTIMNLMHNQPAWTLALVFIAANFVAAIFLSWTPAYLYDKFHMSLALAGFRGTTWLQLASILGVIAGGALADRLVKRSGGGRIYAQAAGLMLGAPFLIATGQASTAIAVTCALLGFGLAKGIYDANIWASLYDVVPVRDRGVAVGVMNSLAWIGGGVATLAVAAASTRFGFSACLSASSILYALPAVALLVLGRWLTRTGAHVTPRSSAH
jgi:predicted MFS family arabinose efflux permease